MKLLKKLRIIASSINYIDICNQNCKSVDELFCFVKLLHVEYDKNDKLFDPWIFVAGYPHMKEQLWDVNNDSLHEELACYHYIAFSYTNNYYPNRLGYLCTRDIAFKSLKNVLNIAIVGNGVISEEHMNRINEFDIVMRCNHAPSYRSNDKIDYLIYRKYCFHENNKYERFKHIYCNAKVLLEMKSDKSFTIKSFENQEKYVIDFGKYNIKHVGIPSTGFIAYFVMKDYYPGNNVELFGFGFKGAKIHHMDSEREYFIQHKIKIN